MIQRPRQRSPAHERPQPPQRLKIPNSRANELSRSLKPPRKDPLERNGRFAGTRMSFIRLPPVTTRHALVPHAGRVTGRQDLSTGRPARAASTGPSVSAAGVHRSTASRIDSITLSNGERSGRTLAEPPIWAASVRGVRAVPAAHNGLIRRAMVAGRVAPAPARCATGGVRIPLGCHARRAAERR